MVYYLLSTSSACIWSYIIIVSLYVDISRHIASMDTFTLNETIRFLVFPCALPSATYTKFFKHVLYVILLKPFSG